MPNPFDNLLPTLGPFADVLGPRIGQLISLIWFVCIVAAAIWLTIAIAGAAAARKQRMAGAASEAGADIAFPAVSLVLLGILPLIIGVLI